MLALPLLLLSGAVLVSATCDKKYKDANPNHSACLPRSSNYVDGGVSAADKKQIVDEHNNYRRDVAKKYKAADMQTMVWDDEIAKVAQSWAENCNFAHDQGSQRGIPGKYGTGQNIAMGAMYNTWPKAIKAWYDEIKDFSYGGNAPLGKIGHFTQVTWASTVRIGCGFANCKNVKNFYVCNYGPAGNSKPVTKPWKQGSAACSDCSGTCKDGLCDCKGKACFNGGTLDPNTCKCKCKDKTYDPEDCKLDCSKVKDKFYCSMWGSRECSMYSNAPADCPHLCKVCP